jgi:hypothetical protein
MRACGRALVAVRSRLVASGRGLVAGDASVPGAPLHVQVLSSVPPPGRTARTHLRFKHSLWHAHASLETVPVGNG